MLDVNISKKGYAVSSGNTDSHIVLQDVKFEVQNNEFVCIVGPSGCGKTTTLRLILGLDGRYDGHISVNTGQNAGVVFQEPRLLPWRSVLQNITMVQDEPDQPLVEELLDVLGLSNHKDFFPGQLSLGLARRAALARAFAVKPSLLILDEPFVSLDEPTAQRLRQLLLEIWSSRPTMALMVTHNIREAMQLADRIVVFSARPGTIRGEFIVDVDRSARTATGISALVEAFERRFPESDLPDSGVSELGGNPQDDRTTSVTGRTTKLRVVPT
ncbi:MAG: ATP-binding cassette domain-containing protein [Stappiaceae bacterium]